jgi:hypothetical protein
MTTITDAYDRFSKERFPLPSESQLKSLEQRIGVSLPDDYRQFVLQFNGGYFNEPDITPVGDNCPRDVLAFLYGIGASHEEAELGMPSRTALFDNNDPPYILPIGDTGMGGLIILVTEPEGRGGIFLKQAFGSFHYLTKSIEEFFELLRRDPTSRQS